MKPIISEEIYLRPLIVSDAEEFALAVRESFETAGRWVHWCHREYSSADAMQWINSSAQSLAEESGFELGIFSISKDELSAGLVLMELTGSATFVTSAIGYENRDKERGLRLKRRK